MPRPIRGEVWLVDLGLAAKVRPCLVVSIPIEDKDRALVTVLAHTTSARGSGFEVTVKSAFLREGVFDAQNIVTIPQAKFLRRLGLLSNDAFRDVEKALCRWLGIQATSDVHG